MVIAIRLQPSMSAKWFTLARKAWQRNGTSLHGRNLVELPPNSGCDWIRNVAAGS